MGNYSGPILLLTAPSRCFCERGIYTVLQPETLQVPSPKPDFQGFVFKVTTRTPKMCRMMACFAVVVRLEPSLHLLLSSRCTSATSVPKPYLENQEDLISILRTAISHIVSPNLPWHYYTKN